MGEVGDLLFGASALGDILMRRHPAAIRQRLVQDLDRTSVGGLGGVDFLLRDVSHGGGIIFVVVAHERSGGLAMRDDPAEGAAPLSYLRRQAVHLTLLLVA